MIHFRKMLAILVVFSLALCLLASCRTPAETDSNSTSEKAENTTPAPAETTTAEETTVTEVPTEPPTEPPKTLYDIYAEAVAHMSELKSEKFEVDTKIDCTLKSPGTKLNGGQKQHAFQILADQGSDVMDLYTEAEITEYEKGKEDRVRRMTAWVKDGIAYIEDNGGKTRTRDLASLHAEKPEDGLHSADDLIFKLKPETLNDGVMTEDGEQVVLSMPSAVETEHDSIINLLQISHALEITFGPLDQDVTEELMKAAEVKEASLSIAINEENYFSSTEFHLLIKVPVSKVIQGKIYGRAVSDSLRIEVLIEQQRTYVEPGKDYSVDYPEDPDSFFDVDALTTGADSLEELVSILAEKPLFTAAQVKCMTQEFLFGCLYEADPQKAAALYEEGDFQAIADFLNEKLLAKHGWKSRRYDVEGFTEYPVDDSTRATVKEFYESNHDAVVAQYGEYFVKKVLEENEGRTMVMTLSYSAYDPDGNAITISDDFDLQLVFNVIYGKYYWYDFSLDGNQ